MRHYKIIELDAEPTGRKATLRELTPERVRAIIKTIKDKGQDYVFSLLYGELQPLADLLGDCAELSPEVGGVDGLSYSEVFHLTEEFKALNPDFFRLMGETGGVLAHLLTLARTSLNVPVAPSSEPDTAA